jgi:hypothetical protein
MKSTMHYIIEQYKLQTKLFINATTGYSETDAEKMTANANHVKWLTGHIASSRFFQAYLLGLNEQEPFPELFGRGKGQQADTKYPSMQELTKDWNSLSEKMIKRMEAMTDAEWSAPAEFPFPMADGTLASVFAFMSHHEAYTIGQIAYIRRIHGLESMKY